jgi:TetR/AcrR family transcriptional repressor of nem operon
MFADARGRFDRTGAEREPGAALGAYVDFYLSAQHRDARDRGCPLPALSSDLPRMEPVSRERFGKGVATLTGWMAEALERHGVADAGAVASAMLSQMVGALSLARAVSDAAQSDAILAHARDDLKQRYRLGDAA